MMSLEVGVISCPTKGAIELRYIYRFAQCAKLKDTEAYQNMNVVSLACIYVPLFLDGRQRLLLTIWYRGSVEIFRRHDRLTHGRKSRVDLLNKQKYTARDFLL